MIDQVQQAAQETVKIPTSWIWAFFSGFVTMVVGQLFLIFRELLKYKDFRAKNGLLNEIKQSILGVKKEVEGMTKHCTTVSGALGEQTKKNQDQILELWKKQGE